MTDIYLHFLPSHYGSYTKGGDGDDSEGAGLMTRALSKSSAACTLVTLVLFVGIGAIRKTPIVVITRYLPTLMAVLSRLLGKLSCGKCGGGSVQVRL